MRYYFKRIESLDGYKSLSEIFYTDLDKDYHYQNGTLEHYKIYFSTASYKNIPNHIIECKYIDSCISNDSFVEYNNMWGETIRIVQITEEEFLMGQVQ